MQEKDTSTRVNAMKKMLIKPVVDSALLSILFDHFDGSFMSKAPKNEIAKKTSRAKKMRLNTAPVAISFSLPASKMRVSAMPRTR